MRAIDVRRNRALQEIRLRGEAISSLSRESERIYKDNSYSGHEQQELLDEIWRLITTNQIRLAEILRENGL